MASLRAIRRKKRRHGASRETATHNLQVYKCNFCGIVPNTSCGGQQP